MAYKVCNSTLIHLLITLMDHLHFYYLDRRNTPLLRAELNEDNLNADIALVIAKVSHQII